MKIKRMKIENLLSYDDFELEFSDFTVIVGPNNVGKTNIVRIIEFIKYLLSSTKVEFTELEERLHNPEDLRARVEIDLELNNKDIEFIKKLISWHLRGMIKRLREAKVEFKLPESITNELEYEGYPVPKLIEEIMSNDVIRVELNSLFLKELEQFQEVFPELFKKVRLVWNYKGEVNLLPDPIFEVSISKNEFKIKFNSENEIKISRQYIYLQENVSYHDALLELMEHIFLAHLVKYIEDKNANLSEIIQKAKNKLDWKSFALNHFLYTLSKKGGGVLTIDYNSIFDEDKIKAKETYETLGWGDFTREYSIWDVLKWIFTSSITQLSEIRDLPSENEYKPTKEYNGRGENLTSYLHCLKELGDPKLDKIKENFRNIFPFEFDTKRDPTKEDSPKLVIKTEKRENFQ